MFNLIVAYNDPWPGGTLTMEMGRIFEHTDARVRALYANPDGSPNFDALRALPTLVMQEGRGEEPAFVASITRVQQLGRNYSVTFVIDNTIPPLRNSALFRERNHLLMDDWEFNRNHWAVKDTDLFRTLLPIATPARRLPSVFNVDVPEIIDRTLVAVMMPFGAAFTPVYASIQQATANIDLRTQRADDLWEAAELMQDIVTLIDRALVVVCDCTGRNPNVFYEAGIAHAFGREVVLVTQSAEDIPFDLRHLRYLTYLNNKEGRTALTASLQNRLGTIAAR